MPFADRVHLIESLEKARNSKVVCYVTSLRENVNALISDDAVREFIDHLIAMEGHSGRLDVLIISNGGDSIVPWRLIPILREYSSHIAVLIPFKAYSAATILALGANEIVMHKFGAMGPIDPTVTNSFNPSEQGSGRRFGISVEDVKAYISFIRNTAGINHEAEVIEAVKILATSIHPLALGNVERFLSQSRMIATKLLELHTDKGKSHEIATIVEALASKLYFHGHPINRKEAKQIGMNVLEQVPENVEILMWKLYESFEAELEFRIPFDPVAQLHLVPAKPSGVPGQFTELASIDTVIRAVVVESARLFKLLRRNVAAHPYS